MSTPHKNCITLVCNQSFLEFAKFVANDLLNQPHRNYDIVICSSDDLSSQMPDGARFCLIETDTFTDGLPENVRLKKYTYWRLPAIEALASQYERVLYLDTDVFVNTQRMSDIFSVDMGGNVIAAVRDVHQSVRPARQPRELEALGLKTRPYFNAGVLLIDSQKWIDQGCLQRIIKIGRNHTQALYAHDQSLLNLMANGRWTELSPVWNWQYSARNCFLTEFLSPRLIHFAGEKKLWHEPDGLTPRRYWERYRDFRNAKPVMVETENFPEWNAPLMRKLGQHLLKNLWYLKANMRYMSRFPSPMSTEKHSTEQVKEGLHNLPVGTGSATWTP